MELRAYGVATTLYFPLIDKGATDFEATPVTIASGDLKISKDGGAFANTTTASFSHVAGGIYSIPLTATEMQAKVVVIKIIDQTGTKEWEDQAIVITTVNHASAEIPSLWAIPQSMATGAIAAASFAAGAIDAAAIADGAIDAATLASGTITSAKFAAGAIDAAAIATDAIGAAELASDAVTEIAAGVWNALVATYQTNSTFGKAFADATTPKLAAVTSGIIAADVWGALVASYQTNSTFGKGWASATTPTIAAGVTLAAAAVQAIWDAATSALSTASSIGKLLVDNINATISSRLASASYTAPLDAAGTRSAVGLASANLDTQLGAIDDYVDTEVAAIKAKTDLIPASPAAVGDIPTAIQNADALLNRDVSNTEGTAAVHSLTSIILKLCSRFVASTGRTYRTNGTTVHMTQTPTTDPAADPITELGVGS